MVGLLKVFVLFLVINKCHSIGIEYYDDKESQSQSTQDVAEHTRSNIDSRRYEKLKKIATTAENVIYDRTSAGSSHKQLLKETSITSCAKHFANILPSDTIKNKLVSAYNNFTIFPADIIKDYEYIYDDDSKPQALRDHEQKMEQKTETNSSENNIKIPLVDFFNIESAIQQMDIKIHSNYSENNNLWYSMEDLPCWDLPLLYGEFGTKKKFSEVFLMDTGKLKNVIEKKYEEDWFSGDKPKMKPLTYYTSKWCTVEPCYGDHTLCLFTDTMVSSLCDKAYEVMVPNILQQATLVNTLNSMRNKIAYGKSHRYSHLPPAANMKQIIYDYDLEKISRVWLHQCIPGPAPCSALDGAFVTQLECTKYAKYCCINSYTAKSIKCTPKPECSLPPVIGCLHVWFWSAGDNLTATDVKCGHTSVSTYSTVQLLWATTYKIGCAYGQISNGDVRVICNFSPGAPFTLDAKLYCGIIGQKDTAMIPKILNVTDDKVLLSLGIKLNRVLTRKPKNISILDLIKFQDPLLDDPIDQKSGIYVLNQMHKESWVRNELKDYSNGTKSMIARLIVKYKFIEQNEARCDSDEPIYVVGEPGSMCTEKGRRYNALCYDFRDPTPGYRLVAVIAPIALFSLILYDLFSGVVRQTNY